MPFLVRCSERLSQHTSCRCIGFFFSFVQVYFTKLIRARKVSIRKKRLIEYEIKHESSDPSHQPDPSYKIVYLDVGKLLIMDARNEIARCNCARFI